MPGEIITWVASKDQDDTGIAKVMEHERPGFKDNDFDVVQSYAETHKGRPIPAKFWEVLEKLRSGNEEFDLRPEALSAT